MILVSLTIILKRSFFDRFRKSINMYILQSHDFILESRSFVCLYLCFICLYFYQIINERLRFHNTHLTIEMMSLINVDSIP